jgi:hypothetical protein
MKKFFKKLFFTLVVAIIFGLVLNGFLRVLKHFFGEIYYIDAIYAMCICVSIFFIAKNGIKKSDLTSDNIKHMEIKYGSVALFYAVIESILWILLIYLRK